MDDATVGTAPASSGSSPPAVLKSLSRARSASMSRRNDHSPAESASSGVGSKGSAATSPYQNRIRAGSLRAPPLAAHAPSTTSSGSGRPASSSRTSSTASGATRASAPIQTCSCSRGISSADLPTSSANQGTRRSWSSRPIRSSSIQNPPRVTALKLSVDTDSSPRSMSASMRPGPSASARSKRKLARKLPPSSRVRPCESGPAPIQSRRPVAASSGRINPRRSPVRTKRRSPTTAWPSTSKSWAPSRSVRTRRSCGSSSSSSRRVRVSRARSAPHSPSRRRRCATTPRRSPAGSPSTPGAIRYRTRHWDPARSVSPPVGAASPVNRASRSRESRKCEGSAATRRARRRSRSWVASSRARASAKLWAQGRSALPLGHSHPNSKRTPRASTSRSMLVA